MNLVIAYYVSGRTYEFDRAKLVDLETDELVDIQIEDDFLRYKDYITLPDSRLKINSFKDFLYFVVSSCENFEDLIERNAKRLVLAAYTNGLKVLDLENGDVYSYHKNSIFLSDMYYTEYNFTKYAAGEAVCKEVLGCRYPTEYSARVVCSIKGELDVVRTGLETPWLELYDCGSGVIDLEKFQSLDGTELVVFPSELKYLMGVKAGNYEKAVRCGTMMFTTNTKYIKTHGITVYIKFKKLITSRKCVGVSIYAPKYAEYID